MVRVLFACLLLCGSGVRAAPLENFSLSPAELQKLVCIAGGCGAKQRLLDLADAENILFAAGGRLFVSGGLNVYEIEADAAGFRAEPLLAPEQSCNFTGLAFRPGREEPAERLPRGTLYAACGSGEIYGTEIVGRKPVAPLAVLARVQDAALPNGAVVVGDFLYITNGPITEDTPAKIMRFGIDPKSPLQLGAQRDWLTEGLTAPNGLDARFDERLQSWVLYFTDGGGISRVAIRGNGFPGTVETFYYRASHLDDLTLVEEGILAADFFQGSVVLIDYDGALLRETAAGTFASASHVHPALGPLFPNGGLLVTEKGILGEHDSAFGNALSWFDWDAE